MIRNQAVSGFRSSFFTITGQTLKTMNVYSGQISENVEDFNPVTNDQS